MSLCLSVFHSTCDFCFDVCLCCGIEIIIVILKSVCNSLSLPKVKMEDFFKNIYQ